VSGLRARRARITLLGLVAALGLTAALTMPAFADHDPADGPAVAPTAAEFPGGPPVCPEGTIGIRFGDSQEDAGSLTEGAAATVTFDDESTATVTLLSLDGEMLTFEVDGGLAALVFVKGGTEGQNIYDYRALPGGGIAHDDGLVTPTEQGISHIDFCVVQASPEDEEVTAAAASVTAPTCAAAGALNVPADTDSIDYEVSPAYTAGATGTFTVTATAKDGFTLTGTSEWTLTVEPKLTGEDCGGTLGGNPTPVPAQSGGGEVPDTAMGDVAQLPVTWISLAFIAAVALMCGIRLAQRR
jgi:hypothetical protein